MCWYILYTYFLQHYTNDSDGLCTRLIRPVKKIGDSFGTVSIQDFKSGGWVITRTDLELGELIGKGDFGGKFLKMVNILSSLEKLRVYFFQVKDSL